MSISSDRKAALARELALLIAKRRTQAQMGYPLTNDKEVG